MNYKSILYSLTALFLAAAILAPSAHAASTDSASVVSAALGEVGYTEGEEEYSKYGEWYGLANAYWCDMFVSWCAMKGDVPKDCFPRNCSCTAHVKLFQKLDRYQVSAARGGSYVPQQGDVIFFYKYLDDPKGKISNHTGLVLYVEDGYVYTIEGNALSNRLDYAPDEVSALRDDSLDPPDHVVVNRYPLDAPHIHGYGVPAYDSRTPLELEGFVDLGQYAGSVEVFQYLCDAGLMPATSAHTFSPAYGMTRGEFLQLVVNFFGIPADSAAAGPFADAEEDSPYYSAAMAARAAGLVSSTADNRLLPDIYISPGDAQEILGNALAQFGLKEQFSFSLGDLGYLLTPYTTRADIAQAFYTLCERLPLTEEFTGQGEAAAYAARELDGICYVSIEALRETNPELELAAEIQAPAWNTERVLLSLVPLRCGELVFAVNGFLYQGTVYVDLSAAAVFLPLDSGL